MKRTALVFVLLSAVSYLVPAQTTSKQSDEARQKEVLLRLTDEITSAKTKRDTSALDRLLADEYVLTNPAGFVANKSEYLDGARADSAAYESVVNHDQRVSVYGEAAVVTGATTVKGRYDGRDIGGRFRFTHVFVRRQDRWQVVATQLTRIADQ